MPQQQPLNVMKKVKVRMLDAVAGLKDPLPTAQLDEKYKSKIAQMNKGRNKPFSEGFVEDLIKTFKMHDRYGEEPLGFPRDWAFKPDQETYINADLAEKWQDAGLCIILDTPEKKAA